MKEYANKNRKKARQKILFDSIGILLIILSPFIFKLHQYLSTDPDSTISFLGYIIDNHGFADLNTFAWFLLSKIVPFYLFIIWFLTCKHWWYHIILIPATMYAFQVFEVLYSDDNIVDTRNIMWLLPVCMVVIPIVYFIRIKLVDKYVHGIDLEAMEAELKELKQKEADEKAKKLSKEITKRGKNYNPDDASEELIEQLAPDNFGSKLKKVQGHLSDWLHLKF